MNDSPADQQSTGPAAREQTRTHRGLTLALFLLILLLAVILRTYNLGGQSLWNDEGTSVALAQRGLMTIAQEFLDSSARIDTTGVLPLASVVRATVEVIRTGQQHGSIRDGEPLAMTAALHGALLHGCLGRPVYHRTATDSIAPGERFWTAPLARAESAQTCPSDPARSAREAHQRDDAGAGCGEASRRYWDAWPSSLRAGTAGLDQLQCRPRWPICTVRVLGG